MPKRFTVIIPDNLWAKIRAQEVIENRDASNIVRYAVAQYIEQFKLVLPTFHKFVPQYPKYDEEL